MLLTLRAHVLPLLPSQVTEDVFLQACECAWNHLWPARTAVRATCRRGRTLHDRLLTRLQLRLHPGRMGPKDDDGNAVAAYPAPTPDQLRHLVSRLLERGARLQSLALYFSPPRDEGDGGHEDDHGAASHSPKEREEQL